MNASCRWEWGWCGYGGYETRTQRARRGGRGTRGGTHRNLGLSPRRCLPLNVHNVSRPPSGCGRAKDTHTLRRRRRRAFPSLGPRDQDLVLMNWNGDANEGEGPGTPSSAQSLNTCSKASTHTPKSTWALRPPVTVGRNKWGEGEGRQVGGSSA